MKGKCPFCDMVFDAGNKINTNINKHIRMMAIKSQEKRGNHPEKDSVAYKEVEKIRRFRKMAKSSEEKIKMTAARKKRSREMMKLK